MTNLPTNPPNLHTPSYSKKSKTHIGDRKKQLEFEQMLCKNVVWREVDDAFQELSKRKPLFIGDTVEMLKIWHLLQCDLVDWDWRVEKKNCKKVGCLYVRSELWHYYLLCTWQVHV